MASFWIEYSADSGDLLGVVIIEADENASDVEVADKAINAGLSPGPGAIHIKKVRHDANIPESYRNRLLSQAEADELMRTAS